MLMIQIIHGTAQTIHIWWQDNSTYVKQEECNDNISSHDQHFAEEQHKVSHSVDGDYS